MCDNTTTRELVQESVYIVIWTFLTKVISILHLKKLLLETLIRVKLRSRLNTFSTWKCPYSAFFWSVSSRIRTEYGQYSNAGKYELEKLQIQTFFTQWLASVKKNKWLGKGKMCNYCSSDVVFCDIAASFCY